MTRQILLLLGDDLVLDVIIDALRNDVLLHQLILALVRAAFDDAGAAHVANTLECAELFLRGTVDVEQFHFSGRSGGGRRRSSLGWCGRRSHWRRRRLGGRCSLWGLGKSQSRGKAEAEGKQENRWAHGKILVNETRRLARPRLGVNWATRRENLTST